MVVERFLWPEMAMATISRKHMVKEFAPQARWDTLRARNIDILTFKGAQCHRLMRCPSCVKTPFIIFVSQRCVQHSQIAGVGHVHRLCQNTQLNILGG